MNEDDTLTILPGQDIVIKISQAEILAFADEIVRRQANTLKIKIATSIYEHTMNCLDIPQDVQQSIRDRLKSGKDSAKNTETKELKEKIVVEPQHSNLYNFISAFVNAQTPENVFEKEEFEFTDIDINTIPSIIKPYGFDAKINKDSTITIRLRSKR